MALSRLLQITGILLEDTQLLLKKSRRIKLCYANLANRAVTDKVAKTKDVGDHSLIVRLSEHETHEFADRCK